MLTSEHLIIGAVAVPFICALLIRFIPEGAARVRNTFSFLIASVTAVIAIILLSGVISGEIPGLSLLTIMPGLELAFRVDPLSSLFGVLAAVLWIFAIIYSTGYMAHEHKKRRYFVFYLLSLSATMGIALSANLLTLYLFYEFLTFFTYPLVIHEENEEAYMAGMRYMVFSLIGAAFILAALVITYSNAGSVDFVSGGVISVTPDSAYLWQIVFLCFIVGFGVKAAIMPLHSWLPSAMAAPTPVSALLHAVAVVKAGVFGILRVMYSLYGVESLQGLELGLFVLFIASITILAGSIIAMRQDVLKRRLAYSTISQLSYIILGAGLLTYLGLTGSLLHMVNHALLKITLFFCAGAIITVTGKKKISELKGVGRRMPLTMLAFSVGAIGMVGILPVNGFISKWYLITGSLEADFYIVIGILVISAVLNAAYFFPIVINAFFREGNFEKAKGLEAPPSMLIPILSLAVVCVVFGVSLNLYLPYIDNVVSYLF